MRVSANWGVSVESGTEIFDLDDLYVMTEKEWKSLSEDDKKHRVQMALDDLPARSVVICDDFSEIDDS